MEGDTTEDVGSDRRALIARIHRIVGCNIHVTVAVAKNAKCAIIVIGRQRAVADLAVCTLVMTVDREYSGLTAIIVEATNLDSNALKGE
jgi:2-keto-4-pentenoate hydratase